MFPRLLTTSHRQPLGIKRLNRSSPLAKGLVQFFDFSGPNLASFGYDHVTKKQYPVLNNNDAPDSSYRKFKKQNTNSVGQYWYSSGTMAQDIFIHDAGYPSFIGNGPFSHLIVIGYYDAPDGYWFPWDYVPRLAARSALAGIHGTYFALQGGGQTGADLNTVSIDTLNHRHPTLFMQDLFGDPVATGPKPQAWLVRRSGPEVAGWINGKEYDRANTDPDYSAVWGDGWSYMGAEGWSGCIWRGYYFFAALWGRALSDAEARFVTRYPWSLLEGPRTARPPVNTIAMQYAEPISDIAAGAWLPSSGSDLYAMVDEPAPGSPSDYIYTFTDNSEFEIRLKALTTTPTVTTSHKLEFTPQDIPSGKTLTTRLMAGATQIAVWTDPGPLSGTLTKTLTGAEAAAIAAASGYGNLRVKGKVT